MLAHRGRAKGLMRGAGLRYWLFRATGGLFQTDDIYRTLDVDGGSVKVNPKALTALMYEVR